ncbi:MAG: hypothetical protein LBH66_00110 [Oscillospiraceae bacterium]|nr:hypothetical protein [Oscillospiraceae bacterium]
MPNHYAHAIGKIDDVETRALSAGKERPAPEQAASLLESTRSPDAITLDPNAMPATREELAEFIRNVMNCSQSGKHP